MKTRRFSRSGSCFVEVLETRIALSVHEWTGLGANNLWSNPSNWVGGSPDTDFSGNIDLVFHSNLSSTNRLVMMNDIPGLVVDSITFDANGGTNATGGKSSQGYTLNGLALSINTGAPGQDPFGIDVSPGLADLAKGIVETFNARLILNASDATFRIQDSNAKVILNGDVSLDGRTLTLDLVAQFGKTAMEVNGNLSNGNLTKTGSATAVLSGDNSHTNTTANGGTLVVTSDTGLGLRNLGTVVINDPARVVLRDGVTVEKPQLNLNANGLGGGLGADGNTTNTFRGTMILFAGAGGVALGAGMGPADSETRLIIDGIISGATSTLSLNGSGVIEFTQNNFYSGITNLNGNNGFGALQIDSPGGLGASGSGNEVQLNRNGAGPNGSALWLNFDGTMSESILFAGAGVDGLGAVRVLGDHVVTNSGNITLIAGSPWSIGVDSAGGLLTLTGVIDSQGATRPLTKVGEGLLVIGGGSPNTWLGGAKVLNGTLRVTNTTASPLGNSSGLVAIYNDSTLDLRPGVEIPNVVQLGVHSTLSGSGSILGTLFHSTLRLAPSGHSGTYVDEDGDLVKFTSSRGRLEEQDFIFKFTTDAHQQLQQLSLDIADARTSLNFQAKPQAGSGNSLANVGAISASNIALGAVTIDGDLGRIAAKDITALTVNSMGAFGTATQAPGGTLNSPINGAIGSLKIKTNYISEVLTTNGRIGSIKIGGSWLFGRISVGADIGSVAVTGDLFGISSAAPAILSAFGKTVAPTAGRDTAIGSIKIGGNVGFTNILAGYTNTLSGANADASVGKVIVGKNWFGSNLLSGVKAGSDTLNGTTDDVKISPATRDNLNILSRIGAIVIKGTAEGTVVAGDHYGIIAEQIVSVRIGTGATATQLAFTPGPRGASDFFNVGTFGDFGIGEVTLP